MKYILLLFISVCSIALSAQEMNWKEHEKAGDEMLAKGKFAEAADHYEMAWLDKPSKKELLSKAAETYWLIRDYRKAGELYQELLNEKDFPLSGLYYGRSLKQLGQYQKARTTFEDILSNYNEDDERLVKTIVRKEIKGCGLAQQWSKLEDQENKLEFLSGINTGSNEFAPLPFSDDILYYSSTESGDAKILRTQKSNGRFANPVVPKLPRTPGGHFCNGTFTPDNERFYFTVCQGDEGWKGQDTKCNLYVTMRENNGWSVPQSMRDYVKMDGTTVTHPFVYHEGDTEILYFSSDRSGGKGGLDIWYMTRQIAGKDIDFTYPVNAGRKINTIGDEITPFYNQAQQKFYFSSNGHVNIGGFDIFVVEGTQSEWGDAKNLEKPYNSSADDYYFAQTPSGASSFFTSNRMFGSKKTNTTDDDLFFFGQEGAVEMATVVSGKVFDKDRQQALTDVEVAIYEKVDDGLKRLLESKVFANGQYEFPILPEREFLIEASKDGYADASFEFNTFQSNGTDPGQTLYLEKGKLVSQAPKRPSTSSVATTTNPPTSTNTSTPTKNTTTSSSTSTPPRVVNTPNTKPSTSQTVTTTSTPPRQEEIVSRNSGSAGTNTNTNTTFTNPPVVKRTPPSVSTSSTSRKTSTYQAGNTYTNSRYKKDGVTTNAPRHSGVYFKVQLSVVIDYDLEAASFSSMQEMGRLDTEFIIEKGWTRVLLADFFDLEQARTIMDKARLMGYPEAFIVRYKDGYRKN